MREASHCRLDEYMRMPSFGAAALVCVAVLASASSLIAQATTGRMTGRVVDAQGLGLRGVNVTATGPQGARTAATDADGRWIVTTRYGTSRSGGRWRRRCT